MVVQFLSAPMGGLAIAILIAVAVIHMYWALGGAIGVAEAVPSTGRGPLYHPTATASLLVALSLVVASDLMLVRVGVFSSRIPLWGLRVACGALAAAFLARAIGDFRYFGFFKRVKGSRFARLDTAVYSPLCVYLAVSIGANTW